MSESTKRVSKRKLEQKEEEEWNLEHKAKKFKSLCSGLGEYECDTIEHLKKYHYFINLNYSALKLGSLSLGRNNTYFYCHGLGIKLVGKTKCNVCLYQSDLLRDPYYFFDKFWVKEFCIFLDKSENRKWIQPTLNFDAHSQCFIINICQNNRTIKWTLSKTNLKRVDDVSGEPWISNDETNINSKYLINEFKKYFSNSLKYCRGISGHEWCTEKIFGCSMPTAKWINNGELIIHHKCLLKSKKSQCKNCKILNANINRIKGKNNYNQVPSKHTGNIYLNSNQKNMKIQQLKLEKKMLTQELLFNVNYIEKLKKEYSVCFIEKDTENIDKYGRLVLYVLKNYFDIKQGLIDGEDEAKIDFIHDQFKYAKRRYDDYKNKSEHDQRKGMKWSVATIDFASELLSKGRGTYKKAHDSSAIQLPSLGSIKRRLLKFRHTDMSSMDIMNDIGDELTLYFGSIEEAQSHIFDISFDEMILSDEANVNVSDYTINGRPAHYNDDNLLIDVRQKLFNFNNDKTDNFGGSKHMMQVTLRSSTSGFIWHCPYWGSEKGLSSTQILCYIEEDFLLPLKLCLNVEISSMHGDLHTHHQQYILYKTGSKILELLNGPIEIPILFYENDKVLFIPDKDHSIKAIRNAMHNNKNNKYISWSAILTAFKLDTENDCQILEFSHQAIYLNNWTKMNMKLIFELLDIKAILALKELDAKHGIAKLTKTVEMLEVIYKFYIGKHLNINVGYKYVKITSLNSPWFTETQKFYTALITFISNFFPELANITLLSIHGLYYGMRKLAILILSSGQNFYFCPFKFGEAISELCFCKIRAANKAIAKDYGTGIAYQNAAFHRSNVAANK